MVVDFPRRSAPEARKNHRLYFEIYSAQRLNAARIGFLSCSSSSAIAEFNLPSVLTHVVWFH
jgi:hypothetical protein